MLLGPTAVINVEVGVVVDVVPSCCPEVKAMLILSLGRREMVRGGQAPENVDHRRNIQRVLRLLLYLGIMH
jgi:hypothetical protein